MTKRRLSRVVGEALPGSTPGSDVIASLDDAIAGFIDLDVKGLCLQWRNHLGGIPPAHLPRWLLLRILAYRVQVGALGGLDKETLRILRQPKGQTLEISGRASFRGAGSDNAGRSQPESGGAARQRMERQSGASDGPGTWLRLERRNLRQPVAGRQGDDRHNLERPSVLRLADRKVRPIRKSRSQGRV